MGLSSSDVPMEYGALTSRYWFAAASSFVRVRMLHFWSGLLSQEANACFNPNPCSFSGVCAPSRQAMVNALLRSAMPVPPSVTVISTASPRFSSDSTTLMDSSGSPLLARRLETASSISSQMTCATLLKLSPIPANRPWPVGLLRMISSAMGVLFSIFIGAIPPVIG